MTAAGSSSSFSAFATADAGFEYLATAEHYRHLATGIVDALRRACLVLVTGDPPASPPMLATALREVVAPRPVIELFCGPDLDCEKLFGGGSMQADTPAPAAIGEEPGRSAPPSPIFVFANVDRLSDGQIEKFREAAQTMPSGPHGFEAGVLLAHSDFVARAESAELHLLDEGRAAHLRVQQLERDEVEAFILHQLPPGGGANLLTAQRVALIAITSGGNPAAVNRLARRMLEIEPDVSADSVSAKLLQRWRRFVRTSPGSRSVVRPDASTAGDEIAPRPVIPRRYAVSLRLPAGIVICLGVVWLVAGAFESQHLDVLVGLMHDRILPRHEQAEAPGGLGAAPSAEAAIGSSSVNVNLAAASPSAASAGETTPEPVATSADHPGATSAPRSIPEPAPQPVAGGPRLPAAETAALVARGDAFLAAGDIASARLFFEHAADSGDSRAAMRMAVTYDAAFLDRAGLHGLRGDPEQATLWYRRARELGEGKAEPPPGSLGTSGSAEPLR